MRYFKKEAQGSSSERDNDLQEFFVNGRQFLVDDLGVPVEDVNSMLRAIMDSDTP